MSTKNSKKFLIYHHTGGTKFNPVEDTSHHTLEIVNEWHRQQGYKKSELGYYVGYQYLIEKTGRIRQARLVSETGFHCAGMNRSSIGICFAGNFDRQIWEENHKPTYEQTKSFQQLVRALTATHKIPLNRIVPHNKFAVHKTCAGENLDSDWGYKVVAKSIIKDSIKIVNSLIMIYTKFGSLFINYD